MTVVATSASLGLAAKLASLLDRDFVVVEEKVFPDGEKYVRVPRKIRGKAILVHSMHPPQDERFVQLLLAIDALKGAGASEVIAVVPYLAYARQDKRFMEGEAASLAVVLRAIEAAGASALVTVDAHNPSAISEMTNMPYLNILPVEVLVEYFKGKLVRPLVVAPDKGAVQRARLAAELLGTDYDYLEKRRDRVTGEVSLMPKSINVGGRDVLLIDDIVSTGGTLALAARSLKSEGANRVFAACTHALLIRSALDKLYSNGVEELVATDTVPSPVSKVSVAKPLAEAVAKLL